MKILIHSNAPWMPTGYGKQTALLIPRLLAGGHKVVVSCVSGLNGAEISFPVPRPDPVTGGTMTTHVRCLPAGQFSFGVDTLPAYIADEEPDLTLLIMDCRMLGPVADQLASLPGKLAAWVPSDTSPLSRPELAFLSVSKAHPIAMTRFAEKLMFAEGLAPSYVPHMTDTQVFKPDNSSDYPDVLAEARREDRRELGIPAEAFVVGMVAANHDAVRKGFPEQFEAFRRFRSSNLRAHLVVHTVGRTDRGHDLYQMAADIGLDENAISFAPPMPQLTGRIDDKHMAKLYRSFDILSLCSYGEGFGVPLIEAQACGTPVVTTEFGAMAELGELGFVVDSEPYWNPVHKAWWGRPSVQMIADGYMYYAKSDGGSDAYRRRLREWSLNYDVDNVYQGAWCPLLERLVP
jgi:glycosyltransferase involved in cell wall biosynthesis